MGRRGLGGRLSRWCRWGARGEVALDGVPEVLRAQPQDEAGVEGGGEDLGGVGGAA